MPEDFIWHADDLARDWTTLWQSELAAIASDPETTLVLHALASAWLQAARAFDWPARPDAAARPAPAGAAPGARDAEIARLRSRVGELERRLDGLDGRLGDPGADG